MPWLPQFDLVSVLGCIHAKDKLRNRDLLVGGHRSRSRPLTKWQVVVTVAGESTPVTVTRQGDHFKVGVRKDAQ